MSTVQCPTFCSCSEKLLPGEEGNWEAAVQRAILEELGPALPPQPQVGSGGRICQHRWCCFPYLPYWPLTVVPVHGTAQISIDREKYHREVETRESQSYPGLISTYVCHRVEASVEGLPQGDFTTVEAREDGVLQHVWEWRAR